LRTILRFNEDGDQNASVTTEEDGNEAIEDRELTAFHATGGRLTGKGTLEVFLIDEKDKDDENARPISNVLRIPIDFPKE
jgi:hypothetical protein